MSIHHSMWTILSGIWNVFEVRDLSWRYQRFSQYRNQERLSRKLSITQINNILIVQLSRVENECEIGVIRHCLRNQTVFYAYRDTCICFTRESSAVRDIKYITCSPTVYGIDHIYYYKDDVIKRESGLWVTMFVKHSLFESTFLWLSFFVLDIFIELPYH